MRVHFSGRAFDYQTLRVYRTEEGTGEHCQVGNLRLATGDLYDWLDETLVGPE